MDGGQDVDDAHLLVLADTCSGHRQRLLSLCERWLTSATSAVDLRKPTSGAAGIGRMQHKQQFGIIGQAATSSFKDGYQSDSGVMSRHFRVPVVPPFFGICI